MVDVPFPLLTSPGGVRPQTAGGRLENCFPVPLPATAGKPYAYRRVAGLSQFGTAALGTYRGGIQVQGTFYGVFGTKVYTFTVAGGAGVALGGNLPGTAFVACASNNAPSPDVVFVSPGDGAFVVSAGNIIAYPDADVLQPNWVVFHKSFFIFTYGDGKTRSSDPNSLSVNTLNNATAESKPDTLYRPLPLGNGQLLLAGSTTIEVWGGQNDTGYPFNYIATIARGIAGPNAICGNEDGWGKGIFYCGDDNRVGTLQGYTPTPISIPDLDRVIQAEPDKSKITMGVYVADGVGFVVVAGPGWCWEYDTTMTSWHERKSYLKSYWRGQLPIMAFGFWLCGDRDSTGLLKIDPTVRKELGNPLRMRIETGPLGAFPAPIRINGIELYMTKGASNALGHDPDETDAQIEISISRNGGQDWSNPRSVPMGRQSVTDTRVRSAIWGQAQNQGVRWRFDESAGVDFAFMGADMQQDVLR